MSAETERKEDKAMSTIRKTRQAHKMIDVLKDGNILSSHDAEFLRSFLPELPKQKTLEEITAHVYDAWLASSDREFNGNEYDPDIAIEDWLLELHKHLKELNHEAAAAEPAHPEFLETEADYQKAPKGTIVAASAKMPYIKGAGLGAEHLWRSAMDGTSTSFDMSIFPMSLEKKRVLRWGWGE